MPERDRGWLRAGAVGSPHGLDGSFNVRDPNPPLLVLGAALRVNGEELRIVRRAGTDQRPIVRLEGCEDRDAAGALRGAELWADRATAPDLDEDEWWAEDLEGCVVSDHGRELGRVTRVRALPSCEVLEVTRGDGGEVMVPLVRDAVVSVDVQARRIEVDLSFLGEG